MSRLAAILRDNQTDFLGVYGQRVQTVHHRTIEHILACHTPACGEIHSQCEDCLHDTVQHPSCGDRFCPSCQHLANSDWLARQHVLPKGFRRVRDYGFLHGNAKRTLQRIQLMLKVRLSPPPIRKLTQKCCPHCNGKLHIIWLKRARKATQIGPSSITLKGTNTAMDCA